MFWYSISTMMISFMVPKVPLALLIWVPSMEKKVELFQKILQLCCIGDRKTNDLVKQRNEYMQHFLSSKLDTIEWYKMCLVVYYINESYLKTLLKKIHTYSRNPNKWRSRTSVVLGISMQPLENENQWKHLYLMFWEIIVLITTSYNNEKIFFHIDKPHSYFMTLFAIF